MTSSAITAPTSWVTSTLTRVAGSAVSWFLFTLSFSLLFQVTVVVMALGGSCASGGPYEIAVECPESVAAFAPLSIFGGLIAVAVGAFFARGFGTPLTAWAWPILFGGLGGAFLWVFIVSGEVTGLIIGVMFLIMGLVPLALEVRASPQRILIGPTAADGSRFFEGARARRSMTARGTPNPDDAVRATPLHWLAALVVSLGFGFLGYWVAGVWFAAAVAG